jgi:hypothetical protein
LFNNEKDLNRFYTTEDVLNSDGQIAGTKVILNIKCKISAHQTDKEIV